MKGNVLEQSIVELGFANLEEFARIKLIDIFLEKVSLYEAEIAKYEKKYKMSYSEFQECVSSLSQFGILEKEDDSVEWESILHSKNALLKKIETLKSGDSAISSINYKAKLKTYFQNV